MMDQIVPERKWHLIRNDNGEWISDDNVTKKGVSFQHGMEGSLWCYKHEIDEILKE